MKQIIIRSMPYGQDNELNPWGDFTHLVQETTRDSAIPELIQWIKPCWKLRCRAGQFWVLDEIQVQKVLKSIYSQQATQEFPLEPKLN